MLKAVLTKEEYEAIGTGIQPHYAEKDDKFFLGVEPVDGWTLEVTSGLKSALEKKTGEAKKAKEALAEFKDIDPKDARDLMGRRDEILSYDPSEDEKASRTEFEKQVLKKQEAEQLTFSSKFEKEIDELTVRRNHLQSEIKRVLIDQTATVAIAKRGGVHQFLHHNITSQMKTEEVDGQFVPRIVDSDGTIRLSQKPGVTDPMDVDELVALTAEDETMAAAFPKSDRQGGGGAPSDPGGSKSLFHVPKGMSQTDYKTMHAAAEKAGASLTYER